MAFVPTGTTSFTLTVVDPCLSAVIAGTVPTVNVAVYAALGSYGAFMAFSYTSSIGSTACGTIGYTASEAPPAAVSSLSTFVLAN